MGSRNNGFDWEQIWASGDTANAYAELTTAKIGVTEGFWVFRLFAVKGGAKYSGYTERTEIVAGQENALSFTLALYHLGADSANSTGGVSVTVAFSESRVTSVTAEVRSLNGTSVFSEEEITASGNGTKTATYAKSGISAGTYAVVFRFYATDSESGESILLGSWVEYAGIASGVTSVSDDMTKNTIESLDSTYSITYNYNRGSLDLGQTAQGSYSRHNAVTLPTETQVSRTGYTFAGWYDNAALTGTAVTEIPADSTGNKSFYAKWEANTYTVTYDDGVSDTAISVPAAATCKCDENFTVSFAGIGTRTGYTFAGWTDGTATYTSGGTASFVMGAGDVTLTAVWEAVEYTITYALDGGTNAIENPSAYTVETPTITLAEPAKTNHTFLGWYTAKSGDTFSGETTAIMQGTTGNITLYARWELASANYTVKHCQQISTLVTTADGKTAYLPDEYEVFETETLSGIIGSDTEAVAKEYDGFGVIDFTQKKIAADGSTVIEIRYYRWQTTIIFRTLGSSGIDSYTQTLYYGVENQTLTPNRFTKEGYVFVGWSTTSGGEKEYDECASFYSRESVSLYPVWELIDITLKTGAEINASLSNFTGATKFVSVSGVTPPSDARYIDTEEKYVRVWQTGDIIYYCVTVGNLTNYLYWKKLYLNADCSGMFQNLTTLQSIETTYFDTSKVTDMSSMFYKCSALTSLDVSGWDTAKVTDMRYLFYDCNALASLNVGGWNTEKVTNMQNMFCYCALTSLDVSGWNTGKVEDMNFMFESCSSLTALDVSGWDTAKVTNMCYLFKGCSSLSVLDLSSWNTAKVTKMHYMFNGCSSLETIYASALFVTTSVTNSNAMFTDCINLKGGDGTSYSWLLVTDTVARIDTPSQAGYFTAK